MKSNGVDFPIDTSKKDYELQIQQIFPNQTITSIFNSVGGKTFKKDIQLLENSGTLVFFGISDRINQKKGLFQTLLQMLKIGKIHPALLILKSQTIVGLNLLEIFQILILFLTYSYFLLKIYWLTLDLMTKLQNSKLPLLMQE